MKNNKPFRGAFAALLPAKRRCFSIQSRVFMYFLLFTGLLLVLLWLFQIVFLDEFYRLQKTETLKSASDSISRNIQHENVETLIQRLAEENNFCALVTNQAMEPIYNVDTTFDCVIHHLNQRDLTRMAARMESNQNKVQLFPMQGFHKRPFDNKQFDGQLPLPDRNETKSLVSVQRATLADGSLCYIFLNTVVTPVTSTVQTIRNELVFITIILIFLSFLLSSVLSRRISQPIVKTTLAAHALSHGEFHPVRERAAYREIADLNTQLTQAAKDLHRVEEMQRELIANISHDLRTPLTLIEGYVEIMRDLPGENTPENLQVILDETKRLSTLVNTVLDYSKTQNQAIEFHPARFNLTQSIRSILSRYNKLTQQEGYHIVLRQEGEVYVFADEMQVGQVIYNLTNNAITYTGADQTVILTQSVQGNKVKIEISDSGEGIPQEELPYIWFRYYRGKKPHKRPAVGTGLGLNIVQGILKQHGMEYGVESQVGKGSTFWFLLPLAQQPDHFQEDVRLPIKEPALQSVSAVEPQDQETVKKLACLSRIAQAFQKADLLWAVGGSLMLYLRGGTTTFHDLDLTVALKDAETARKTLLELGGRLLSQASSERFQSGAFYKMELDGAEVDLIADFGILLEGKLSVFPLKREEIDAQAEVNGVSIPLQALESWLVFYQLMDRPEKAALIQKMLEKKA